MEELVRTIVSNIVDDQSQIDIKTVENEDSSITIEVKVASDDTGRVIGRSGRVINSIRTLTKVKAAKENKKVFVEVL